MTFPHLYRATPLLAFACASAFAQTTTSTGAPAQTVLVTANRQAQAVSDVLIDHEIISAEEIAGSSHRSIAELLQKQRGIEISSNGGIGNVASVFLRGTNNQQTLVLIDGVRVGSSTNGGATWSTIPLSQIDHIEIVYGPLSSLYGADAVGGVIQIFTKQGSTYLEPTLALGVGSHRNRTEEAGISGSGNNLRFALRVAHESSDGFSASKPSSGQYTYNPDDDGYRRHSASGNLAWSITKGHEIGVRFLHSRLKSQFDAGSGYDDRNDEQLETAAVYGKHAVNPQWQTQWQFSRSTDKSRSDASYGASYFDTTQDYALWQNDITLGNNLLQLVLEHRSEQVDSDTVELARKRNTNSQALAYQLHHDAHSFIFSVRHDDSSQYHGKVTGSVAYGYRIDPRWRVRTSLGTSFRAPTFSDLYYPGFGLSSNRPERGRNAEIGLHYNGGQQTASLTYYHNRITDLLVYASVCPVLVINGSGSCVANIDKAVLSGFTLAVGSHWGSWSMKGTLDWQDARDDTTHKRLARRANQHGNVALEYTQTKWRAGVETTFSDRRFDDSANRNRLGGYGVVNLYASIAVAQNWSVLARWNNVASKDYELAKGYATDRANGFIGVRYGSR